MKKTTRLILVIGIMAAICFLTACSKGETMPETAEEIMGTVLKKLKKAKELNADLSIRMDMELLNQPMSMTMDSNMRVIKNPIKQMCKTRSEMNNGRTTENAIYMGGEGEAYYAYAVTDGAWKKVEITEETITNWLKTYTSEQAENLLEKTKSFSVIKTEEEEDKTFTVLEGELPIECLGELMQGVALSEQMGMDFDQINLEEYNDVLKVTLWVEQETVSLYRVTVDFTGFMEKAYRDIMVALMDAYGGNSQEDFGIKVNQCIAQIRYKMDIEDFEIPSEALGAEEMDMDEFTETFGTNGLE